MTRIRRLKLDHDYIIPEMKRCAAEGLTRRETAARLGISYHTVRMHSRGMKFKHRLNAGERVDPRIVDIGREARYQRQFGCSYTEFHSRPRDAYRMFLKQKDAARCRGICWEMTFHEWWLIWDESGHWSDRGVQRGCFQMCRYGDDGPYSADNVYIATLEQNVSDSWANGAHL